MLSGATPKFMQYCTILNSSSIHSLHLLILLKYLATLSLKFTNSFASNVRLTSVHVTVSPTCPQSNLFLHYVLCSYKTSIPNQPSELFQHTQAYKYSLSTHSQSHRISFIQALPYAPVLLEFYHNLLFIGNTTILTLSYTFTITYYLIFLSISLLLLRIF